jgi:outer membrane immunogenic protein
MRKLSLAGIAFVALGAGSSALAADMAVKTPAYKSPPPVIVDNWTGFYVGLSVGGRWADTTWTTVSLAATPPIPPFPAPPNPQSFDSSTARVGGYFGYIWQLSPFWVGGIEADFAWGNNNKTIAGIPGTACVPDCAPFAALDSSTVKAEWDASIRARIGVLVSPTTLLYATGGVAWQRLEINASCFGNLGVAPSAWCVTVRNETVSWNKVGWTIGGGVEALLWGNWLARAEYRYADYGSVSHTFFVNSVADQVTMNETLRTHTASVGLAYKFGYARSVVARY